MKFEDLIIDNSQTIEKNRLLENRLIAIRNRNRGTMLSKLPNETHKLETITTFRGVTFINDAKSENINSTYYAIEQIKTSMVWIIGSDDTQTDYKKLLPIVSSKVRALVCFGTQNERLIEIFKGYIPLVVECQDINTAVREAFYASQREGVVMFSSACPCGQLYADYQQRGEAFKNAIAQL
ncbi:MAG: hypothetical protein J5606_01765 [Bacteroidales bacterium]|nr:hypothetical protein [Bacteroidales bacterium]